MKYRTACNGSGGFTLLEIIVVMTILGILIAFVAPQFIGRVDDARVAEAKIQMKSFETALKLFKVDNGFYPETVQGLNALVSKPSSGRMPKNYRSSGYLDSTSVPKDPWGTPFIYISPGTRGDFEIISLGGDASDGGSGADADIRNWEE
ncbi:type II secretion system major pseudopilin GspG [Nitrospirota bacterium]